MISQTHQNLFLRDDTFFGVCEGLGEITRIPSNLFRIALAPALVMSPMATLIGYLAVGLVVAAIRFIFPVRRPAVAAPVAVAAVASSATVETEIEFAKAA